MILYVHSMNISERRLSYHVSTVHQLDQGVIYDET